MLRVLKPKRIMKPKETDSRKPTAPSLPSQNESTLQQTPLLMFGFDDTFESDYTIAFQDMAPLGLMGTSFINARRVGLPGYLSLEQIHEMKAAGWDFQCHTDSHTPMILQTEEELHLEMQTQNAFFEANGLGTPKHITYPTLKTNEQVMNVVGQYRLTGRANSTYTPSTDNINPDYKTMNYLAYTCFEAHAQGTGNRWYIRDQIHKAIAMNGVASFLLHRLTEDETDFSPYTGFRRFFKLTLSDVVNSGIEVVTTSQMYERVNAYRLDQE